ncbi:MAG: hypothetical protein KDK91_13970 [Gammaproteobacteria bacterium]|nr:hypothetical protein [Gammaproteobacteria bacterium]
MKLVTLVLLLANLGYFIVQYRTAGDAPGGGSNRSSASDVASAAERRALPLLSEVPPSMLTEMAAEARVREAQSDDSTALEGDARQADARSPEPDANATTELAADGLARPLGMSARLPGPPGVAGAGPATAGRRCFTAGPLQDEVLQQRLQTWLTTSGLSVTSRVEERQETALYWIHLPPFATRAEALAQVRALKAAGVDDIGLIDRGDMAGAVSLGVYRQRASLERRLADLRDKGYEPTVTPRLRSVSVVWLDILAAPTAGFEVGHLKSRFESVDLVPTPCPDSEIAGN